jgi:archaetidylinositol phosphate synthase
MRDISKHQRKNDTLLNPLERPTLKWLAAHMPAWVTPDFCTAIGVVGALVIMISYALSRIDPNFLWLASFGFAVNWFGDSLDGTIARHRRIERPRYGFFIDHTVDAVAEAMIMLGLGLTPYIRFDLACLALSTYFILTVLVLVRTCTEGEFNISFGKLGPTEVRILLILFNTAMYFGGVRVISVPFGPLGRFALSPYDLFFFAMILIMVSLFVVGTVREAVKLAKADRKH